MKVVKKIDLKCNHYTCTKLSLCEGMEVLNNLIVVIILLYIHVSHCIIITLYTLNLRIMY